MKKVNVLVIGSGGREHALAWKLAKSDMAGAIFCAPGNPGTALVGLNVDIKPHETDRLIAFAKKNNIGLTVVGPEQPLVNGIVDAFEAAQLTIFGPNRVSARLEGSKAFAKYFMGRSGIPMAYYEKATEYEQAMKQLKHFSQPVVIKADGLAAGKGVIVCQTMAKAQAVLRSMMVDGKFGEAGNEVVIESYIDGTEISVLALFDGETYRMLVPSQDHKAALDHDRGPNTGGMGAIAPVPWADVGLMKTVADTVFERARIAFRISGIRFKGCLYAGLMVYDGTPYVLEFNVRFGDPETQAILPLLKSDLLPLMLACCNGTLGQLPPLEWADGYAASVVLTSGGYPGKYRTGYLIEGLGTFNGSPGTPILFHAGTSRDEATGLYRTAGGRVLNVTQVAPTLSDAVAGAYRAIEPIKFARRANRTDIGAKALLSL